MKMELILQKKLHRLYEENSDIMMRLGNFLEPEFEGIIDAFYTELMEIPEIASILKNMFVQKNLKASLQKWMHDFFQPRISENMQSLIDLQKKIGALHAHNNVNMNYFTHGISIMKREIFSRISNKLVSANDFSQAFLLVGQQFDILVSIISEAYYSNEMIHETKELSLKMKGMTQNTAIECERLRSLLLDWMRNTLTFLYQTPEIELSKLPKLQYSSFGLWVIYKADLLSHTLNISAELKKYVQQIDEALFTAAKYRAENNQQKFFEGVTALNDVVSKGSWFISTIVDQAIEIDTGMDMLTRLFNRRYLDTILRRQTDISIKLKLPYSVLMLDIDHFKKVNDIYGHDSGDAVLKQFSELLMLNVRASDFIFRYGGEEFLAVLGNTDGKGAYIVAEKIRRKCEEHIFQLPANKQISKTCSIGAAVYDGHPDYNRIVKFADMALYEAKEKGRNQVIVKNEIIAAP